MQSRVLTPSKITAWLDCAHFLTLQHEVEAGIRPKPFAAPSDMTEMLMAKGLRHEHECLETYERNGKSVFRVPDWNRGNETFDQWLARVGNPMADGHQVIYQMPFLHQGVRGIADFLLRVDHPTDGTFTYEPLDAKLARKSAKPGHVLQLCFYADAIAAVTGRTPENMHIWLGSGDIETIRVSDVAAYWRRLQSQLRAVVADDGTPTDTVPVPCSHCAFCAFAPTCKQQWVADQALHLVAGLRATDHEPFNAAGITNMAHLADCTDDVEGLDAQRCRRLARQASLQLQSIDGEAPPFEHLDTDPDASLPLGFAAMPEPDHGDVFLDYEGHPFWSAKEELFFLFGLITRRPDGTWAYEARWAHDKAGEKAQTAALIDWFVERRQQHAHMHVYHYNHTERSSLVRLAKDHSVGEAVLDELIGTGLFVDLYPIVTNALVVGTESYGLKKMEQLAGFTRRPGVDKGAGAVVEYDLYMGDGQQAHLDAIAQYNDDDVRATLALRDWLVEQRPADLPWRTSVFDLEEPTRPDIDDAAVELMARYPDKDSAEYLLGLLLGYWRREWKTVAANLQAKAAQAPDELAADPDVVTGLLLDRHQPRTGAKGTPITPSIVLDFPPQPVHPKFEPREKGPAPKVIYRGPDGIMGFADVISLDPDGGQLELMWSEKAQTLGIIPDTVVLNTHVGTKPKPDTLLALANSVLDPVGNGAPGRAALALLHRDSPRFTPGNGPTDGRFTDDVDQLRQLVLHLDGSYLPVQGPPGTGKTYTGARMVLELVLQNKRVGVTAMSHHAIDNFMEGVVEAFTEAGELGRLRAVRRVSNDRPSTAAVTNTMKNSVCKKPEFNVVAGTTWLFAGNDMHAAPVDVLFIDEAGQLSLADALVAASSANNIVLLGDPLQLPQVSQAAHPGRSGNSVLEHLLGDDRTLPDDRGAFLSTTRRMHPNVSRFISEQIYEGRLNTHSSCTEQNTSMGTGLRWIEVHHSNCSTSSPVEAAAVHEAIAGIIGQAFTDADGKTHDIAAEDVMVVAPYNDQVNLLRGVFDADPVTRGVKVGTVDKFQGQEAPVVFFTMTASTAADISRGADFLFSKNRLNVAISRARAIAYLVCTDDLLNSRARDVESMKLIATLCAFVEHCRHPAA